jgi:hypothetical protein
MTARTVTVDSAVFRVVDRENNKFALSVYGLV